MKRNTMVVAGVAAMVLLISSASIAGQYGKAKPYVEPADTSIDVAFAEKTKSMSDCMTFSAAHKTKGMEADKEEFRRQYGEPIGGAGTTSEYSYGKYTKIILDCSKKSCSCRCLQK